MVPQLVSKRHVNMNNACKNQNIEGGGANLGLLEAPPKVKLVEQKLYICTTGISHFIEVIVINSWSKNWIKIDQELLENIPLLKCTAARILSYIEPVSAVREESAMLAPHSMVKSKLF